MRAFPRLALAASLAVVIGGCGSTSSTGLVDESQEASARLTSLTDLDQRVARVAWRLSQANAELCPTVRQSAGWALHSARQYSLELQPLAQDRFGLRGDLPGVLAAPDGSPAAEAGLRVGDLIVAVDGALLADGDGASRPSYDGLARNVARLDAALAEGAARVTLERSGETRIVEVRPVTACGYEVQLNPSDELNARADGRRLFISTALAGFTQSDDELSIILGHELAHHVLHHREWSDVGGLGRSTNDGAGVEAVGDPERQADRVGLFLSARAGFDPGVAAPFWRRFGASNWRVRYPQLTHASAETRARRLDEAANEIRTLQASGRPVRP